MLKKNDFGIVIIGSGNVASHLGTALSKKGFAIRQVYSKNLNNAVKLAKKIHAEPTDSLFSVVKDAHLYIIAVSDNSIETVAASLEIDKGLVVHTSGSVDMNTLNKYKYYGVFYPLQTFSKKRKVNFSNIPLLIEANNNDSKSLLTDLGSLLSSNVQYCTSEKRKHIHLAAVFACNFTNYMYVAAQKILESHDIDFSIMRPLILETAKKASEILPYEAQTGPAIRNDKKVLHAHLDLLSNSEELHTLYKTISKYITKKSSHDSD